VVRIIGWLLDRRPSSRAKGSGQLHIEQIARRTLAS
jgi:hypothetical protein